MQGLKIKKETAAKNAIIFFSYLLIFWGFYRFLIRLPEEVEEFVVKPLIWLVPVFYFLKKEKNSPKTLGITTKNLFPSLYLSVALGVAFAIEALFLNYVKYGHFILEAHLPEQSFLLVLCLSLAAAISEELAFRGYIFTRVFYAIKNEWIANILTSIGWAMIHLPASVFLLKLNLTSLALQFFLTFIFGVGSALVYARTKNIFSSIILHVLWLWPIMLFR